MLGRRKKKVLLHALLSFLFILVVFGAAWYFAVTYTPPTTQDYVDRSMTYLDDWSEELGVDAKTRESIYWDWIDENNTLVPLTGNEFYLGTIDVNGIGSYGSVDSDHLEKVNKKFFQPLLDDSDRYFDEKRFLGDKRNSREKEDDPIHTIHRGYQKGKMYCLLRLTPQSDPFGSLFCGTIDEEQKSLQKKVKGLFSSAYNPKNFTSFRVTKIENDFALGVTLGNILGYTWIATRSTDASGQDGKWSILWKGQEIPLCSEMKEKSIPKSIYLKCYDDE